MFQLNTFSCKGLIAEFVRRHHYRESVSVLGRFMPIRDMELGKGLRGMVINFHFLIKNFSLQSPQTHFLRLKKRGEKKPMKLNLRVGIKYLNI